jgi:hypothetical protein
LKETGGNYHNLKIRIYLIWPISSDFWHFKRLIETAYKYSPKVVKYVKKPKLIYQIQRTFQFIA